MTTSLCSGSHEDTHTGWDKGCRGAHLLAALMDGNVHVPNKGRTIACSITSIAILRITNAGGSRGTITFQCIPEREERDKEGPHERRRSLENQRQSSPPPRTAPLLECHG